MQKPKKRDTLVNREEYIKSYKVLSAVINYALTEFTQPWWWCLYNLMLFLYLIRVWWLFLGTFREEITLNFLSMLFPDKQSILYSNQPTTTRESAMLQVFPLMSERCPVEHTRLPLFQRLKDPIQCTDPPSTVRQVLFNKI